MSNREEFEIWAKKEKLSISYGDCGYVFSSTEMAWRSWQTVTKKTESQLTALTSQLESVVAENAALKSKGREVLKEAAYVYSHYNRMVDHLDGESVDGQTLHEFQEVIESETPATSAFLAEVRASGVDMMREHPAIKLCSLTHVCDEVAAQLRQGGAV